MSKKQDRLEETLSLIRQAIQACGTDFATVNVRAKLIAALNECSHIEKKRDRRENNNRRAMQEAIEKAQKINDEWWKRIEENVRKAAKESTPKQQTEEPEEME